MLHLRERDLHTGGEFGVMSYNAAGLHPDCYRDLCGADVRTEWGL